uniref:Uncharacterized protein n=1 Tax=Micrurus lemniscatus lemniscatus TaxID=129467 RepID=A0A2D4HEN7_MICLE
MGKKSRISKDSNPSPSSKPGILDINLLDFSFKVGATHAPSRTISEAKLTEINLCHFSVSPSLERLLEKSLQSSSTTSLNFALKSFLAGINNVNFHLAKQRLMPCTW